MPYLQGFVNDIFISFAHIDNTEGWVETFQIRLRDRLAQIGIKVGIWRDTKLRGTDLFSDEIFEQLRGSALLLSIVSPTSISSHWCQDERQKFEQFAALNGGFRVGNTVRAIKVVKTPLSNDEHRTLFDTLGFEFYARNDQSDHFREFNFASPEFTDALNALAQDIVNSLNVLRQHLAGMVTQLPVYVAATTSDLDNERQALVRQITDWGYSVVPAEPSSLVECSDCRSEIESTLAKSILTVHLVSNKRGVIPDGEDKSIVALQYEVAQSRSVDRVLWIRPGTQPDQTILNLIQHNTQRGAEVLEERTLEDLKEVVEVKLKSLRDEARLTKENGRFNIYLVCDRQDHPYLMEAQGRERALQLKAYLDSKGCVVWLPPVSQMEETRRRRDHRETLKLSDAVLLYWGNANEDWFRENLRDVIKARTRRSGNRHLAAAIYLGGPPRNEKTGYKNQIELVFEQFDTFQPDGLKPLFQQLQRE
jgi:hypothetical protein